MEALFSMVAQAQLLLRIGPGHLSGILELMMLGLMYLAFPRTVQISER